MRKCKLPFDLLDDDVRWTDPHDCCELLYVGIWFLYETLVVRHPGCSLVKRILAHGDTFEALYAKSGGQSTNVAIADMANHFTERNLPGTLGHSLWHLREYLDSPVRYEI